MEDILRKLVAFPTVTGNSQAAHEALDYIIDFVTQRGMHLQRYDSNGYESFVATTRSENKTPKVMLAAHLDVVPAADELFEMRKSDGKIYGRGVLDMKFAIAAYMQLVDDLQESLHLYDFGIMITTDEEMGGMDGVAKLVDEGYIPGVCILPDGGDNWQIQLFSKGFLYLQLRSYGTPAHGSRPWLGVNAIYPLMETIQEIQQIFKDSGPDTDTFNVGAISGGTTYNQVADFAEAKIDIRLTSEANKKKLLAQIEAICKKHNVELLVNMDGAVTDFSLENPLIAPFADYIHEVTGIQVQGSRTLGSNDCRYLAAKGVPCISVYPTGAGHHGPEEWIDENAFYQFKQVLERYVDHTAKL